MFDSFCLMLVCSSSRNKRIGPSVDRGSNIIETEKTKSTTDKHLTFCQKKELKLTEWTHFFCFPLDEINAKTLGLYLAKKKRSSVRV